MSGFIFRLQSLLNLRVAERGRRRAELAAALRAERLVEQQIHGLHQTVRQTRRGLRKDACPGTVNVNRLLDAQRYELVLNAQIDQMQRQLEQVSQEVARRRQILVEASRTVRMLEKLRDRRQEDHRLHAEKSAQRELDEIAARCDGWTREECES